MFNLILAGAQSQVDYIPYIVIWSVLIVVGTVSFAVVIHYTRRFFFYKAVQMFYNDGKKKYKERRFYKIGTLVEVDKLSIFKRYKNVKAVSITSEGEISKGNLQAFIMPDRDVTIFFKTQEKKRDEEVFDLGSKKLTLSLPKEVKDFSDSLIRPLLLLSIQDIIDHVEESNSHPDKIPLYNSYKYGQIENREVAVLYNGKQVYGLAICSEAVFKLILRIDDSYVRHQLEDIDTASKQKGDIWSFVLDTTFTSVQRVYDILDRAYTYVLLTDFVKTVEGYIRKDEEGDRYNSQILAYNEEISRSFDPVFDRVIIEGQKYKDQLVQLFLREKRLDVPFITPKDLIYEELEKVDEQMLADQADQFLKPEFLDTEKDQASDEIQPDVIPDIHEALSDLLPVSPTNLKLDDLIAYIMARKDMVSLTIDLSSDYSQEPTTMKFLKEYFALINKGKFAYNLNFRFDPKKIDAIAKVHPNIVHVRNGEDMKWFRVALDQTFTSIDELYKIIVASYEFTKEEYYASDETLDREAEFKPTRYRPRI